MTGKESKEGILIEDVTSSEYASALAGLRDFLKVDVSMINTAKDLSEPVSSVAPCLQTVIRAKSKLYEEESARTDPNNPGSFQTIMVRKPMFKETLNNLQIFGEIVVEDRFIRLAVNQRLERGTVCLAFVALPLKRDIWSIALDDSDLMIIPRDGLLVFAWGGPHGQKNGEMYHPTIDLDNAEASRSYARLLQVGVNHILSVLPEPIPVPEVFQF